MNGGLGLLELTRGERELESVFLELAKSDEPARRKKKRRQAAAAAEPPVEEPS